MDLKIPFDNSYAGLPDRFYARQAPVAVPEPKLLRLNCELADELGLDVTDLSSVDGIRMLAGNLVPAGADPISQAYAGHQFGGWVPQLGDGRAVLLGEVVDTKGRRRDIQLKGSGRTPYSRGGDGRAWLGPVLREYLVSEAMHALGIPTTRALAAVTTGQQIQRETALPGAVLARVATSHIRVGTFQYFAARQDTEALQILMQYVITRHYPDAKTPLDLLHAVIAAQASLIARWMSVGFIHGVMNTDNMAISGETIDYGPCAFMDDFNPDKVFSSIDRMGRYAYGNQPEVAVWNLAQFASCLLPLMGEDGVEIATRAVHRFPDLFRAEWLKVFRTKLGLATADDKDQDLIQRLLDIMATQRSDFTNTFRRLATGHGNKMLSGPDYDGWHKDWQRRIGKEVGDVFARMLAVNPAFIARNHQIERVIQAALSGDLAPFEQLHLVLRTPYAAQPDMAGYQAPPEPDQVVTATFCGT